MGEGGGVFSLAAVAPSGLGWDWATYPLQARRIGSSYELATDPRTLVNAAIWSAPIIYVWPGVGSDSNSGASYAAALATVQKAIQNGNATGAPYRVFCKGALTYTRSQGTISDTAAAPTQHCAIIADGGRVRTGTFDALSWAADATYTNTYKATRSSVAKVCRLDQADAFGNYGTLANVADAAACNATPNSWAQVGSVLYVNANGTPVTNSVVRAYLSVDCFDFGTSGTTDVYVEGFDLEGGNSGSIRMGGGTRNLVVVDTTTRNSTGTADGISYNNTAGLCALIRTSGIGHAADFINLTWNVGGTTLGLLLTSGCTGKGNGVGGTTNNGWTIHDGIRGIDLGGLYEANGGPDVAVVGGAKAWLLGATGRNSGGGANASEYAADGAGTHIWLEDTVADTAGRALAATNSAVLSTRRHTTLGGGTNYTATGGVIDVY